ncbi:secoisolariciresinol dehydrogenase-like [Macadamia integrifolia]|uniref:secoisolariciresinol dehydrogenase-like n=1 Tax=Macadamia integrifolia TaxID=60698 RepID=UPI001C4FF38B|nr:secoisolariciresinol dehydrogenase-like [Macadamia integrifolia]
MGSSSLSSIARRLEGKVALITGGASGLGKCTAELFRRHGAKVMIADIKDDLAHSVCQDIGPTSASFVHCDVTNESDVQDAVNTTVSKYGALHIMFNNAGIMSALKPKLPNILHDDKADFERVLSVNVTGVFLGTKHAARVMIPARSGSIINTASVCSVVGAVAPHSYTASKHAVQGLTKNTAVDLGRFGIRVNSVSPYVVLTSMAKELIKATDLPEEVYSNLKGTELKPEDVAEAALYLGSDESKYVSGHNLVVDGGFTITNSAFTIYDQQKDPLN